MHARREHIRTGSPGSVPAARPDAIRDTFANTIDPLACGGRVNIKIPQLEAGESPHAITEDALSPDRSKAPRLFGENLCADGLGNLEFNGDMISPDGGHGNANWRPRPTTATHGVRSARGSSDGEGTSLA
jgi:hypothetical protein